MIAEARGDAAALLERVRGGDSRALAQAITAVENRNALGRAVADALGDTRCPTLGLTGPPGAGKSSLINALVGELLPRYRRIGVLTVDPSSSVSGGAVLGDRVRMAAHSANPDVFIRSLAARGHLGGVTRTTRAVIDLLAVAGMDLAIVETVGTGQSEIEVAALADVSVVVCAPGLGDATQAIKAGILEVGDLLVVNKADLPDAARTAAHLAAMLHHRGHEERRALLQVSATTRTGLAELAAAIDARLRAPLPPRLADGGREALAREVADFAAAWVRDTADPRADAIARVLSRGTIARSDAALAVLRALTDADAAGHGDDIAASPGGPP